jgi:hypothetical protein
MAEVVYLLGAGFNYSAVDPYGARRVRRPPLATNFFQVLLEDGSYERLLEFLRLRSFVDLLFEEIRRYWHLDLEALKTEPFDIEECLTLFESQTGGGKRSQLRSSINSSESYIHPPEPAANVSCRFT